MGEPVVTTVQPDNALFGKALFQTKPRMMWENFFSGTAVMEYAATEGFRVTMTCRQDQLPEGVPRKYFHHRKLRSPIKHEPHGMSNQLLQSSNMLKAG